MAISGMFNDHRSHRYMTLRLERIENDECRMKVMVAMQRAESFLSEFPKLDYAFLLPTDTGLKKGIMDAIAPVRDLLYAHKLHDFQKQQQGVDNKVVVDGCLLTASETFGSKVSLYRPVTKKGDPRIWLFELSQHVDPYDLLFLFTDGYTVYAVDAATDFERNPEIAKTIRRCLQGDEFSSFEENLLDRLQGICSMGFIPSVKGGDTGVGMTLEHVLGIPPNSDRGPDWNGIELKAHRIGRTRGRQTLFSEKPCWGHSRYSAEGLLDKFGYQDKRGRTALYTTLYGSHYNPQGFRLIDKPDEDLMEVSYLNTATSENIPDTAVWHMEDVRKHFRDKHTCTFWVGAETRRTNRREEFHYMDVAVTRTPDYMRMEELIAVGWITVDFTLTYQPTERTPEKYRARDHGYLWRANPQGMNALFDRGKHIALSEC